jgi:Tol biopolymer transport system component
MDVSPVPASAVHEELDRVLASETFRGAERSRSLLRFVVEETLEGRADRLKDYTLGAEALGRGEQFDPRTDPIARVEASRLRSRLDLYYATEGADDALRISLPKGRYAPQFDWHASPAAQPVQVTTWTTGRLAGLAIALALAGAVGGWLLGRAPRGDAPGQVRLELTTPPTTDPVSLAVSPDGRTIVFVSSADGRPRLWMRRLESSTSQPLEGTDYASLPFWAPDGRAIGFFADGQIKRFDLDAGLVRTIGAALVPAGAAWNRDGAILHPLVPDSPLFRTTSSGSESAQMTERAPGQGGHRGPVFLPDGRHFLFYSSGTPDARGIYVGELGTPTARRLLDADAPAVLPLPDHILYVRHSRLFAHRIDPDSLAIVGDPVPLADGIAAESTAGLAAVAAAAGTVAYRTGPSGPRRQFVWVGRDGHELARIGSPESLGPSYASLSPDGRRLAVQRSLDGNTDIAVVDVERGTSIRLTTAPTPDIAPVWSPGGNRVVYASHTDGAFQLFEKRLDDSPARLILRTPESKQVTDWSRDGRYLLFRTIAVGANVDIDVWAVALDGEPAPFPVVKTPFEERDAQFSPDGRWIAYHSNQSGQHEVYVQPFRGTGERVRISTRGGVQARWRADGRELFYIALDGRLMSVPMGFAADGQPPGAGTPVALFPANVGPLHGIALHSYIVSPDGQRFLIERVIEEAAAPISIIVNWKPS